MRAATESRTTPVAVYLLFHKTSKQGERLAKSIFRWLRLREQDHDATGVGLPVYFRTLPGEGAASVDRPSLENACDSTSPPLPLADARHVFVVPLVDDHMVADPAWRRALRTLAAWHHGARNEQPDRIAEVHGTSHVSLLPVMVDRSFDGMGAFGAQYNPLRIWDSKDAVPRRPKAAPQRPDGADLLAWHEVLARHTAAEAKKVAQWEAWLGQRARRLRRALTEQMVRDLDAADGQCPAAGTPARPQRLKVFISHAKADGAEIAQKVRDGLAAVSKLEPWFDQNDLVAGRPGAEPMENAAAKSSGGMIAVVTDVYPSRPWCWREALRARTPRLDKTVRLFRMAPSVALHVPGDSWARLPPPLARIPRLGWPIEPPEPERSGPSVPAGVELAAHRAVQSWHRRVEGRVADVVDRLMLELLMSRIAQRHAQRCGQKGRWFMDFVPDARSLAIMVGILRRGESGVQGPIALVYPGHGLRSAEREDLRQVIQSIDPEISLLSSEQIRVARDVNVHHAKSEPMAVSAGGADIELLPLGLSEEHLDDFAVRLTRLLLQTGHRLAYGGSIQPWMVNNNLTFAILDAVGGWTGGAVGEWGYSGPNPNEASPGTPLVNYCAKGFDGGITTAIRADYIGTCTFTVVPAAKEVDTADSTNPSLARTSRALTAMRQRMAADCRGRIVFGGKTNGWAGALPGIAEELLYSVLTGKPVLLLGGLGGCAKELSGYFSDPAAGWPKSMTYEGELEWRARNGQTDAQKWTCLTASQRRQEYAMFINKLTALKAAGGELDKDRHFWQYGNLRVVASDGMTDMLAHVYEWLPSNGSPTPDNRWLSSFPRPPVVPEPHLPYIPEDWNGVLVLSEAQNLNIKSNDEQIRDYVKAVLGMDRDQRAARLTSELGWCDDHGDRPRVHVKPWHNGPLRAALECLEPPIDWRRCAVSNAIPWSWVSDNGKDDNSALGNPSVRQAAVEFLQTQFESAPKLTIACGGKAQAVVKALGWRRMEWRQGGDQSLISLRTRFKKKPVEVVLAALPAPARKVVAKRPDLYEPFNQRDTALFVLSTLDASIIEASTPSPKRT